MHSMEKVGSGRSQLTRAHPAPKRELPSPQQPPERESPSAEERGEILASVRQCRIGHKNACQVVLGFKMGNHPTKGDLHLVKACRFYVCD